MTSAPTRYTQRLKLRTFVEDDAADYAREIFSNPAVMRYLNVTGGVPPSPLIHAMRVISLRRDEWLLRGYGAWAVTRREDGAFMGHAGLYHIKDAGVMEIGYALGETYWGQGYATEAARSVSHFTFTETPLTSIVAVAFPRNLASQRVMHKIGMRDNGLTTRFYGLELASYTLTRDEYLVAAGKNPTNLQK